MRSKRGLLFLSLPVVAGGLLLLVMVASRRVEAPLMTPTRKLHRTTSKTSIRSEGETSLSMAQKPAKPAAPNVVASAAEEVRLQGTYQNYRTAVAMGNRPLQAALGKALRRDHEAALRMAEEDVEHARTQRDREIALKTLDALRR